MELRKIDIFLFKTMYLLAAGIIFFQVLGRSSITSILFLMTFPLTVLLWLRLVRKNLIGSDLLMLSALLLSVIFVLLNAMAANASLNFTYVKKVIMFAMAMMYLQTVYRVRVREDIERFINGAVDVVTILLIAMYFLRNPQMHLFVGRVSPYLTFRFSNPNTTGLFLVCLYMLELYRLFSAESWYMKLIRVAMAVCLAKFVYETQARNSLLVMMIFTVVCGWLVFRGRKNMRISSGTATFVAIFPVLFAAVYLAVVNAEWFREVFAFLTGEGKGLNARVLIWSNVLDHIGRSPLIGAYYQISDGSGISQMHNTHLDIAASYGVPVMIMVCVLLKKYLHKNGHVYTEKQSYIYILGFACAIMLGMGEAALFSGGLSLYIFVGAFLLLSNGVETEGADLE